ncbi:hypothetical protein [Saccharopolyspora mangrovi]|uniref:Uncharacterized protein n=1 Tax=Saccharopolyspora mangrovi TaxID=3082379 RepID=A0ABU6A7D5_9PSEU|nr:hypothetical protein [Saccharopolyspora sp. S2-29]MEB3367368.1 hypothetical protein [Saccharopolyspora sp. S2-29]
MAAKTDAAKALRNHAEFLVREWARKQPVTDAATFKSSYMDLMQRVDNCYELADQLEAEVWRS